MTALLDRELGGRMQARRGELVDVLDVGDPGSGGALVAELDGAPVGLVSWARDGHDRGGNRSDERGEVRAVAVDPTARGMGVGRRLVEAAHEQMRAAGARRVWIVTTNDNLAALGLYQRLGYRLIELRSGAVDDARRTIKPSIPTVGLHGIPMRDELELELELSPG